MTRKKPAINYESFYVPKAEWIRRFELLYGRGAYDYSKMPEKIKQKEKFDVYCPTHDLTFKVSPYFHYYYNCQCPKCRSEKNKKNRVVIKRQNYIKMAKAVHGDAFDYSQLSMEFTLSDSIILYCKEHDHVFFCNAKEHIAGKKCPLHDDTKI